MDMAAPRQCVTPGILRREGIVFEGRDSVRREGIVFDGRAIDARSSTEEKTSLRGVDRARACFGGHRSNGRLLPVAWRLHFKNPPRRFFYSNGRYGPGATGTDRRG
jgi:hypothetical protein